MRASSDSTPAFRGAAYAPRLDKARLTLQIERIRAWALARDWFTLREARVDLERLYAPAVFPESSVSAQLRNLKKIPISYRLLKRRRAGVHGPGSGIWEYKVRPPAQIEKAITHPPDAGRIDAGSSEPDDKGREEFLREARRIALESTK
jgi:hypothetical protein